MACSWPQSINKAFDNGNAQESLKTIGALIVTVTTALAGYKGSILAISTAKQVYATVTAIVNKQRTIEIGKLVLSQGFYDAETGAIVKNMSTRVLLTKALKAQTIAQYMVLPILIILSIQAIISMRDSSMEM